MLPVPTPILLAATVAVQLAWYALMRLTERAPASPADAAATRRKRAWFMTLPIALLFGWIVGPAYVAQLLAALAEGAPAVVAFLRTENDVGRACALSMIAFMSLDILVGVVDYREQIQLTTGWIHHILWSMLYITVYRMGGTQYVIAGACCEMPTFLMALGTVWPGLRQDLLFGATFFFTRIVWFAVLLVVYSISAYNTWLPAHLYVGPIVAALAMHIYWFRSWGIGQLKRAKKAKVAAE